MLVLLGVDVSVVRHAVPLESVDRQLPKSSFQHEQVMTVTAVWRSGGNSPFVSVKAGAHHCLA
jgi:hypothetical protein